MGDKKKVSKDDAPAPVKDLPTLNTPVDKMTQDQLRRFIPRMLRCSTGKGKPGWDKESNRPPWWPEEMPWANVKSDARSLKEKQKVFLFIVFSIS